MKNGTRKTLILISASILVWAASAFTAEEFRWQDVNFAPYTGSAQLALQTMTRYGLPQEAVPQILEMIRKGKFREGTIHKSERYVVMMSGKDRVKENVLTDWKHFNALESEDYTWENFVIRRPTVCNNWLLKIEHRAQVKPTATAVTGKMASDDNYVIRINTIRWDESFKLLPTLESRIIGLQIRQGMKNGRILLHTDPIKFKVEWRQGGRLLAGKTILINGQERLVAPEFNDGYFIEIETINGRATISLPRNLIVGATQLYFWPQENMVSPPHGMPLYTAPGELANYAQSGCSGKPCQETWFHFIK